MYNGLRRRKTYDELIINVTQSNYAREHIDRERTIPIPWGTHEMSHQIGKQDMSTQTDQTTTADKATQTVIRVKDKATQTDVNDKATQANIKVDPRYWLKDLKPYVGPDVVDHTSLSFFGWFKKRQDKIKATQTPRLTTAFTYPLYFYEPDDEPEQQQGTEDREFELPDVINPLLDAFFAPLNFGLGMLNPDHESIHSSLPISVHSSPPISVHSSPPISVHSSSHHTSPPISVHSSPAASIAPSSPSTVPVAGSSGSSSSSSSSRTPVNPC